MTPAEKLLKMIEDVDPDDSDTLDEIDARFWCFSNGEVFEKAKRKYVGSALGDCICINFYHPDAGHGNGFTTIREYYTRSRDVLKAARLKDWTYSSHQNRKGFEYPKLGWVVSLGSVCRSPILPTEELAELHAIIQAKEWDKENAN